MELYQQHGLVGHVSILYEKFYVPAVLTGPESDAYLLCRRRGAGWDGSKYTYVAHTEL